MPATEKTWRDQAKMHVIFGISALVMLVGTIWMLAKDHNREWRKWQLDDRARERWTIEAQLAQAQADSTVALDQLAEGIDRRAKHEGRCRAGRRVSSSWSRTEDERLQDAGIAETPADFAKLDEAAAELAGGGEWQPKPPSRPARRSIDAMNAFIREAKRREDALADEEEVRGRRSDGRGQRARHCGRRRASRPTEDRRRRFKSLAAEIARTRRRRRRGQGLSHRAWKRSSKQIRVARARSAEANRRDRNRAEAACARIWASTRTSAGRMGQPLARCSTRSTPATSSSTRSGCRI